MAAASDARLAKGEARRARRHPARDQGSVLHQGRADHRRLAHPRRLHPALRIDRHRETVGGRRGDARQDQSRRVRDGLVDHDELLRPDREPVAAARRQPAAGAGRLVGRLGGGGRGACRARRDRHRYRRLDPPAGELLRHRRAEADLRPLLALGGRGVRLLARPSRADDPHGARRGDHARRDGRARPARTRPRRRCRCPITRRR